MSVMLDRTKVGISYRLRLTREAFGVDQTVFAGRAGVASNTYNQYESGKNVPSLEVAHKLCDTWRLSFDWIYRGDASSLRHETAHAIEAMRQLRLAQGDRPKRPKKQG
jgi:DNA-binding XRE family transcriptional regulator